MPHLKPVEKIELSEAHTGLRLLLTLVLLLAGAGFITYAFSSLFSADVGWCEIESGAAEYHCGGDFTFLYRLGETDLSATAEKKLITSLYSDATESAFQLFTNDVAYEDVHNVFYINRHPNEEIEVDPVLYKAFSLVQDYGNRCIYLAPIYARYDDLFYCTDDSQAVDFDPYLNPEVADDYAGIAAFANDTNAVDLELLGDSRIRLKVSEEYLAFARENEIESLIDFFWLKNAFIADYLADVMISNGYTRGCLSSKDGFVRNLDGSGESYSFSITDRVDQVLYAAAQMVYTGPVSIVDLRDYGDGSQTYTFANGEIRTPYLDPQDGLCKSAVSELICYSREQGCAETLLQMIPAYLSDTFQPEILSDLAKSEIYSIYCQDGRVLYNDPALTLTNLYDRDSIRYSSQLIS